MKTTLIDNQVVTVPDDLGNAIAAVRQDGKMPPGLAKYQFKKKGKKAKAEEMDEEMMDEDEDDMVEDSTDIVTELLDRADSAIAENAALRAVAAERLRQDKEEEDEEEDDDIEELVADSLEAIVATDAIEQYVAARLDAILEAFDAAKPYLPTDFNLREHADGYAIKAAALAHSLPRLDAEDSGFNWDSAEAIDTGFNLLLSQVVRADSYVPIVDRKQAAFHTDMAPVARTAAKRVRKPDYSAN